MAKKNLNSPYLSPEEIAKLAYAIFEQEGKPHGRSMDHWLQAETLLLTEANRNSPKAVDKKATKSSPARY